MMKVTAVSFEVMKLFVQSRTEQLTALLTSTGVARSP